MHCTFRCLCVMVWQQINNTFICTVSRAAYEKLREFISYQVYQSEHAALFFLRQTFRVCTLNTQMYRGLYSGSCCTLYATGRTFSQVHGLHSHSKEMLCKCWYFITFMETIMKIHLLLVTSGGAYFELPNQIRNK